MQSLEILLMKQEEFVKIEENEEPPATQNQLSIIKENQEPAATARELFIKIEENRKPFISKEINKCRVCLVETSQLLCWTAPIETANHESTTYLECFEMCTRLGSSRHDQLPQTLCFQCAAELRFAYKFIKKAIRSHEILLMKQEEFVKTNENEEPAATQNQFINKKENQEPAAAREFINIEENGKRIEAKEKFIKIAAQPAVPVELQKTYYFVKSKISKEKGVKKTNVKKAKKKYNRLVVPKAQKQLLLNHIKANLGLCGGVPKSEFLESSGVWEYHKKIWEKIAEELNFTQGVKRTVTQWKQLWSSWKYKVKCQYIAIKRYEAQIQAGLELPSSDEPKKLNEMEEEIAQLFYEFKDNELIKKRSFHPTTSEE